MNKEKIILLGVEAKNFTYIDSVLRTEKGLYHLPKWFTRHANIDRIPQLTVLKNQRSLYNFFKIK